MEIRAAGIAAVRAWEPEPPVSRRVLPLYGDLLWNFPQFFRESLTHI
ncbi:MAG: hypothetical protein HFF64_04005 [Oscillospiraceae bacterium]|nr:hypothetical protein [Oscillospiraceae bacterium]